MNEPYILNERKKSKGSIIVGFLLISIALVFALESTLRGADVIVGILGTLFFILLFCLWACREELRTKSS